MAHDKMCPATTEGPSCLRADLPYFDCDHYGHLPPCVEAFCCCEGSESLIARVRADEAAKYFGIGEVFDRGGYERGVRDERERAAERVESLGVGLGGRWGEGWNAARAAAVAAARGGE